MILSKDNENSDEDHNDSLIAQVNSKTVDMLDLKARFRKVPKIRKNNPLNKDHTHKPGRRNGIGQRFSLNKSSAVHEKPHTPRSYLRWKPTGRIFKTVSLRWIPTGKVFIDSTTKVDSEPPNGSNDDITNPYECNQTLYVSADALYSSVRIQFFKEKESVRFSALYPQKKRILLGVKSISLTEAEEEAVAREVHATHAGTVSGPDPEPVQEDQTGSNFGKLHVSLAGPNPEHMDDEFLATAYPKEKSKVIEESDSTIPDPSHQTVTSTLPVIAPFTDVSSTKPSSLVTPPPINTEATTIITPLPEITPFISLQLRVARLEQEMSEVKKTDHSTDVLVLERHTADLIEKYSVLPGPESIKNQESKKSPKEIIRIKREQGEKEQESTYTIRSTDKVALEEFDLKSNLFKHMQKNRTANRNPANYHLYHALMEALIADEDAMDKEVKDRVKDHKRKHDDEDDEDDDDDEGPSAGSNQGKSTKRRRHDSGASGSAQPPPKDDEQSSKKPHDSDASASKQHPTLTSTGWQITDTRDAVIDSSMHNSEPESGHSKHSSDDVSKQDEGHISDLEDTDNTHIPKVKAATWFKPIQEDERPATPEPEWTIPPNDFPEPENNWANAYATSYQVPAENKLQRKTYDIGSFIKWFCRRTGKKKLCKADLEGPAFNLVKAFHKNNVFLQFQMDECHKLLTNKVDLVNPEGHQILRNIYEPLPLGGPPGQVTIQPQFFFNKDLEYLLTGLVPQPPSPTPNVPPTKNDWDLFTLPYVGLVLQSFYSTSQTTQEEQSHVIPTSVEEDDHEPSSEESSSRIVILTYVHSVNHTQDAHRKKDQVSSALTRLLGDLPDRYPKVSQQQTRSPALLTMKLSSLQGMTKVNKDALTKSCWIDAMKSFMKFETFGDLEASDHRPDQVMIFF
ncbi:hypothetical protein Tco_0319711 [Tanacetum coccineum]